MAPMGSGRLLREDLSDDMFATLVQGDRCRAGPLREACGAAGAPGRWRSDLLGVEDLLEVLLAVVL